MTANHAGNIFSPQEVQWTEERPVVVVGGGGCGMVAAFAAGELGVETLILEKGGSPAGNTALSTGLIPAAGTRFQREAGIQDDSPELMARDILAKNGGEGDLELTHELCDFSAGLVEWLADEVGCEMVCYTDFLYPGQSRLRMHGPPEGYGASLVYGLAHAVNANSNVELRSDTSATGLVWDGERVSGVKTGSGAIQAGSVILALNGFGANPVMVEDYLGHEAAAALYFGAPGNTGEGILWGLELSAAAEYMDSYQGHGSVAYPDGPLVTWGLVTNGAILVNERGCRFGDESNGYSEYARSVISQPGGKAWEIFDKNVYDASRGTRFEEVIEAGKVVGADSLEKLAWELGLPASRLQETVSEFNWAARGEAPDEFGRSDFGYAPLLEPPLYGIRIRGALFHTQGGLKVDGNARVLKPDGKPIRGLYAGGGTAAGISGHGAADYLAGNGLLAALGLGRKAGESAAGSENRGQREDMGSDSVRRGRS